MGRLDVWVQTAPADLGIPPPAVWSLVACCSLREPCCTKKEKEEMHTWMDVDVGGRLLYPFVWHLCGTMSLGQTGESGLIYFYSKQADCWGVCIFIQPVCVITESSR